MRYAQACQGFEAWERRQGFSPRSMKGYRTWSRRFGEFLAERRITDVGDIDAGVIADFQAHLITYVSRNGRPYATRTRGSVIGWLRTFFRYLVEQSAVLIDPTRLARSPRKPRYLPRNVLTAADMRRLLTAPDTTDVWGLRDRAMLELLYGTGLRFSELADLAVGDVELEERRLWIRQGKGRKDRVLPLGRWAAYWLRRYLSRSGAERRTQNTARIFLTPRGNRLANWVLNERLRYYVRRAGIARLVTLHTIRHTFATLLLKGGADVRHLQRLLGHTALSSTQVYTHLDLEDLRRVQERCHPRERKRPARR